MKKCSTCERALTWHLRCRVCKSYNWRISHIALSVVTFVFLTGVTIAGLDQFTFSQEQQQQQLPSARPAQQQQANPGSAPPVSEKVRQYRQSGGVWKGRPAG